MEKNKDEKNLGSVSGNAGPVTVTPGPNQSSTFKKEETVVVKKEVLEQILKKQGEQDTELKMLREVADKSRLAWWNEANKKPGLTRVKLRTFLNEKQEVKVILGWETVIDEVFKDGNGVWHEKQILKLYFDDKTSLDVNYMDFARKYKTIESEVTERSKDEVTGYEVLKVVTADKRKFAIDVRFVN